jgi:hypothetical protein
MKYQDTKHMDLINDYVNVNGKFVRCEQSDFGMSMGDGIVTTEQAIHHKAAVADMAKARGQPMIWGVKPSAEDFKLPVQVIAQPKPEIDLTQTRKWAIEQVIARGRPSNMLAQAEALVEFIEHGYKPKNKPRDACDS